MPKKQVGLPVNGGESPQSLRAVTTTSERRTAEDALLRQTAIERLTKRLAKGSGIVFLGQILGRLLGLVLHVALGRLLGVSQYGLYALAISALEFGARLSQLGLANGLVRYVAVAQAENNPARLKGTLLSALSLGGPASLLASAGLAFSAPWMAERLFHNPQLSGPIQLAALALPFYNFVILVQSGLRGLQRMVAFTAVGIARATFVIPLSIALVGAGWGVPGAIGGFAAAALLALLWGLWLLSRSTPKETWRSSSEWRLGELLRFSLPLYLAGFSFLVMSRTDILMLGYFTSSADVGAYRAAVALAHLVVFGLGAMNTAFAPLIADLYHRKLLVELDTMYKTAARWSVLLSLWVALPLLLFPQEILSLYGKGFLAGAWALVVLVGFQLVNAGVGSVGFILQMSGHPGWVLINNLFTAALNVGLNLWWIPLWGIGGAALATGTALALNNLLGVIEVQWLLKMHPFSQDYARLALPLLTALAVYGVLHGAPLGTEWWQDLIIVMTSFGAAVLLVGVSSMDRMVLRAVLARIRR